MMLLRITAAPQVFSDRLDNRSCFGLLLLFSGLLNSSFRCISLLLITVVPALPRLLAIIGLLIISRLTVVWILIISRLTRMLTPILIGLAARLRLPLPVIGIGISARLLVILFLRLLTRLLARDYRFRTVY